MIQIDTLISQYDVLPKQELEQLLIKYQQTHSKQIKDTLILSNLRIIKKVLSNLKLKDSPNYEDYVQIGIIGLIKAIDGYNIDRSTDPWYSYSKKCITNEIIIYLRKENKKTNINKIDIDKEINYTDGLKISDTLAADDNVEEEAITKADSKSIKKYITHDILSDIELDVLQLRFYENKTQRETGKILNMYKSSIYRIEKRLLTKLRKAVYKSINKE